MEALENEDGGKDILLALPCFEFYLHNGDMNKQQKIDEQVDCV